MIIYAETPSLINIETSYNPLSTMSYLDFNLKITPLIVDSRLFSDATFIFLISKSFKNFNGFYLKMFLISAS